MFPNRLKSNEVIKVDIKWSVDMTSVDFNNEDIVVNIDTICIVIDAGRQSDVYMMVKPLDTKNAYKVCKRDCHIADPRDIAQWKINNETDI
jgi:hypothetical protein